MFVANTGSMATLFNEEGINSSGSLTKSIRQPNEMTAARARAAATIVGMATTKKEPIGIIVNKVLAQSIPELQSFVQARAESPATNPVALAVQAALLRATEIGLVAKSIDTDDDDALLIIEDSEQQHVDDNTVESSGVLSPDTAAAIALLVGRISERYKQNGGSGKMADFVAAMKKGTNADNFDQISCSYIADQFTGSNSADPSDQDYYNYYSNVISTGGTTGTTTTATSSGSFWDNLFNNIDKVVDGITKVSGAVNTTVGNVQNTTGGIIDQVNQIGGGIGAASIQQYMATNWLKVVGVILAVIIITILIARAGRNK